MDWEQDRGGRVVKGFVFKTTPFLLFSFLSKPPSGFKEMTAQQLKHLAQSKRTRVQNLRNHFKHKWWVFVEAYLGAETGISLTSSSCIGEFWV